MVVEAEVYLYEGAIDAVEQVAEAVEVVAAAEEAPNRPSAPEHRCLYSTSVGCHYEQHYYSVELDYSVYIY